MSKDKLTEESVASSSADSDLEEDVRKALKNLETGGQAFIGVTVTRGVVALRGFTESYAQKRLAEAAVSRVIGVRNVHDYLEVRVADADARSDAEIRAAAQCALKWDVRVRAGVVAEVTDGVIRLSGRVEKFPQREAAEDAVWNLTGVRGLTNEIRVSHNSQPDVAGDVESAIRRRFGVACRDVWVIERDGVATVSGVVGSLELLREIDRVIQSVVGVVRVDNHMIVG